jgi:hypothetical protein
MAVFHKKRRRVALALASRVKATKVNDATSPGGDD